MKKRGLALLSTFAFLFSLNFARAELDVSEFLAGIDESTVVVVATFLLSFSIIFFSLTKMFKTKDNQTGLATAGLVAGMLSFILTYYVNKQGINVGEMFSNFGVSSGTFSLIVFLVFFAGVIFLFSRFKLNALGILGGLFILLSFFVYAKTLLVVVGVILIAIWFFMTRIKGKGSKGGGTSTSNSGHP